MYILSQLNKQFRKTGKKLTHVWVFSRCLRYCLTARFNPNVLHTIFIYLKIFIFQKPNVPDNSETRQKITRWNQCQLNVVKKTSIYKTILKILGSNLRKYILYSHSHHNQALFDKVMKLLRACFLKSVVYVSISQTSPSSDHLPTFLCFK